MIKQLPVSENGIRSFKPVSQTLTRGLGGGHYKNDLNLRSPIPFQFYFFSCYFKSMNILRIFLMEYCKVRIKISRAYKLNP